MDSPQIKITQGSFFLGTKVHDRFKQIPTFATKTYGFAK